MVYDPSVAMRCSKCGHDSPPGSSFCLQCGTALAAPMGGYPGQTPAGGQGLPAQCPTCRTENAPGMRFCRNCGTVLGAPQQPGILPTPYMGAGGGGVVAGSIGGPGSAPAPMPPMGPPMGPPPGMHGMQPGPMGGPPPPYGGPPPPYQQGYGGGPPPPAPYGAGPMGSPPPYATPMPPPPAPAAAPTTCPRCSSPALPGFAFCQQCGFRLGPQAPAGPPAHVDAQGATLAATGADAAAMRGAVVPSSQPMSMPGPAAMQPPAAPPPAPAPSSAPAAQAGPAWGVAVSVNRDGSDGERFPLAGEYVVVGRAGADIAFDQDRFLARHHARLERTSDGCRVVPIDTQNGVFRKIDAPVELASGTIVLVGREVLRFEKVDDDERTPEPLVRHGVALFGSPPREPWGRLFQLVPSGGVRDIRYLSDDEIVLGREEGDLVYSDDAFLSRRHCTIGWDGTRAVITDLGSSNGTFVRLTGPLALKHGEHVRMGDQLFRIELRR